jgi:hypothetical protein
VLQIVIIKTDAIFKKKLFFVKKYMEVRVKVFDIRKEHPYILIKNNRFLYKMEMYNFKIRKEEGHHDYS